MAQGVIYILTNPSFPEYVKIGYAAKLEERLRQLNRSEAIPYAFRAYATYEVESNLTDVVFHDLIDRLNPDLRSIETFAGRERKREFYAMSPEEAELEANVFLKVIKGKQFEMPIYFDLEEKKQFDLGKEKVSAIMRAFLERVESAGYFTGLYGSASPLFTHTADDIINSAIKYR